MQTAAASFFLSIYSPSELHTLPWWLIPCPGGIWSVGKATIQLISFWQFWGIWSSSAVGEKAFWESSNTIKLLVCLMQYIRVVYMQCGQFSWQECTLHALYVCVCVLNVERERKMCLCFCEPCVYLYFKPVCHCNISVLVWVCTSLLTASLAMTQMCWQSTWVSTDASLQLRLDTTSRDDVTTNAVSSLCKDSWRLPDRSGWLKLLLLLHHMMWLSWETRHLFLPSQFVWERLVENIVAHEGVCCLAAW